MTAPAGGPRHRGWPEAALLAALVAAPTALCAARFRFNGLYGQDAYAYYDYAVGPLRDAIASLHLPPPFFWPPGYPVLVAITSLVTGPEPLAGVLVSLLCGAAVPVFTWLLAREVVGPGGDPLVPRAAGALVACSGLLWQFSGAVMSDAAGLAAGTAGVWAVARYGRAPSLGWMCAAAGALAFALLTRWIYGVVALPCAVHAAIALRRRPASVIALHGIAAAAIVAVVLAPVWLQWPSADGGTPPFGGSFAVQRWSPLNAFRSRFTNADGSLEYVVPNLVYYAAIPARWFAFTPVLAPLILPGLWVATRRGGAATRVLAVGWGFAVTVALAGLTYQSARFALPLLPPLAVLAGLGAPVALAAARRWHRAAAPLAAVAGVSGMLAGGALHLREFLGAKQADLETVRWVEDRIPPAANLVTFGLTATFRHESRVRAHEIYQLTSDSLARIAAAPDPYLLLDLRVVETQWAGRSPALNLGRLRQRPGIDSVGAHRGYSLFRIRQPGSEAR